jgi:hypothetical protein
VIVWLGESQLLEEDRGHPGVIVLPGMDQHLLVPTPQLPAQWAGFDELRARADNRQKLQVQGHRGLRCRRGLVPLRVQEPAPPGCEAPQESIWNEAANAWNEHSALQEPRKDLDVDEAAEQIP